MAFAAPPVDFNYFLARKYALQQQDADATTQNAGSSRIQANANADVAATQARLNTTQAQLMPGESASQNALRAAQARLAGAQADVLPAESAANIALTRANTDFTGVQSLAVQRQKLTNILTGRPLPVMGSALGRVMGSSMPRFSLSSPTPRKLPGESEAAYMDRINGL